MSLHADFLSAIRARMESFGLCRWRPPERILHTAGESPERSVQIHVAYYRTHCSSQIRIGVGFRDVQERLAALFSGEKARARLRNPLISASLGQLSGVGIRSFVVCSQAEIGTEVDLIEQAVRDEGLSLWNEARTVDRALDMIEGEPPRAAVLVPREDLRALKVIAMCAALGDLERFDRNVRFEAAYLERVLGQAERDQFLIHAEALRAPYSPSRRRRS